MEIIDISHILDNNTPYFSDGYKPTLTPFRKIERDLYNAYLLKSSLHTGTHIDIPMHLTEDSRTAADFSLDNFIGRGVLLDVRGENPVKMKSVYRDMINKRDVVLLFTGYDLHYYEKEYFTEHPSISDELAKFLISKKIKILGMDMPAPDRQPFTLHKELLKAEVFVLENLTNLQKLINIVNFEVMALPLKINAEASYVRAVCITDNVF